MVWGYAGQGHHLGNVKAEQFLAFWQGNLSDMPSLAKGYKSFLFQVSWFQFIPGAMQLNGFKMEPRNLEEKTFVPFSQAWHV
jgi:hypothetical protein